MSWFGKETRMVSINEYIQYAEHMYCSTQGGVLARLLSLFDDHVLNQNLWADDVASAVYGKCIAPLDDILVTHLVCVKALHMQNYVEAYNYQSYYVHIIVKLLQTQAGTNWMLPVMFTACMDLRLAAQKADVVCGGRGEILEQATKNLMDCFKVCALDNTRPKEHSKLIGLLNPVNHLLRIYFKLRRYEVCKVIIKTVEPVVVKGPFSVTEQVTFRFFIGRMALVEGHFRTANKHLYYSFRKCHPQSYKNKRIILTYLMPLKMLLGYFPAKHITEKYNMPLFWQLVVAVREGRIRVFEDIMQRNHKFFASCNLCKVMENLRLVTYRNVFKKVHRSTNEDTVPIASLHAGLEVMADADIDMTATQSLIANMIFNYKIKAYMSYQHRAVIFNPRNPFPRLSTLINPSFY